MLLLIAAGVLVKCICVIVVADVAVVADALVNCVVAAFNHTVSAIGYSISCFLLNGPSCCRRCCCCCCSCCCCFAVAVAVAVVAIGVVAVHGVAVAAAVAAAAVAAAAVEILTPIESVVC